MKFVLFLLTLLLSTPGLWAGSPSALELAGKWEGAVAFGKFKFTMVLHVATNSAGRIDSTIEIPEQGQKGLPVSALLFNFPDVRLEIDPFGTAYNGKINKELTVIEGTFEEGPGGRPAAVVFKRSLTPDAPEPERSYTFKEGEARDIRGYWKGDLEVGPDFKLMAGVSIGRLPDGSFRASLDLPEQGASGIPAASTSFKNDHALIEWSAFQAKFEGNLSENADQLIGKWIQGGRQIATTFNRLDSPFQLLPTDLSYVPESDTDIRGVWKGTLEIPGRKLRLDFKLGSTPDGKYAGSFSSKDQGNREIPASVISFSAPDLKLEFKGIRGKYEGTLAKDGKSFEGEWEQFGNKMPLKLERSTENAKKTNP